MHTAIAHLKSVTPYSQSRYHAEPKEERETGADYEARTWRSRMHYDQDGMVYMPAMSFKNCLAEAAKFISMQIPGKGKSTYTKHFEAGVLVLDHLPLGIHKDAVPVEKLYVPSDGRPGGTKRVERWFPLFHAWEGDVTFTILDDAITESVFTKHLEQAGMFIGLGRFRPRNRGMYGRFKVESVKWS